jgi:hypothetical protein
MTDESESGIGLAELLRSLGWELRRANEFAKDLEVPSLTWAEAVVELELAVNVTAKGGIKFSLFGIGAEGGADRGSTRTLRTQVKVVPWKFADELGLTVGGPMEESGPADEEVLVQLRDEVERIKSEREGSSQFMPPQQPQ